MQAHGGRLELTALPRGTCFRVYLPIEAEVLEAVKVTAGPGGPNHPGGTDNPKDLEGARDSDD